MGHPASGNQGTRDGTEVLERTRKRLQMKVMKSIAGRAIWRVRVSFRGNSCVWRLRVRSRWFSDNGHLCICAELLLVAINLFYVLAPMITALSIARSQYRFDLYHPGTLLQYQIAMPAQHEPIESMLLVCARIRSLSWRWPRRAGILPPTYRREGP